MPISVKDLSYTYNKGLPTEKKALDGITFNAKRGEVISIVGHTGSGKSTLSQHLNALIIPQEGTVSVDGLDSASGKAAVREIRRKVGLVFQYPEEQIFAETVEEELAYAPRNRNISEQEIKAIIPKALEAVGLDEALLNMSPYSLSGGQKRRIAIASVLTAQPDYLVLDEPTAGLDGNASRNLALLMKNIASEGKGIIHITHDIELALNLSDRIIILEDGRLLLSAAPPRFAGYSCDNEISGLAVPEVLELSNRLKKAGIIDSLVWNPEDLINKIEERGERSGSLFK